ncbi:MAG TPA: VOC family protein [Candidatus Elarobacter sp.]|jgi:predicted 3-demethylubiquinone-9 3-methyltransferase (glyoxalase superfamily)
MQKIRPFLWFDDQAEEAANFYVSVFPNSKRLGVSHYGEDAPGPKDEVMVARFEIEGQEFLALNGGPEYTFTPAISFYVDCETQTEVDYYWEKLSDGGETNRCGWLTDKFGVTWQIVPSILGDLMQDDDDEKSGRVMQAMLKMEKLDIAGLQRAYDGTA